MTPAARLNGPRRAVQLVRGVAAGVLLATLLVGPPVALTQWSTWPIAGLPTVDQLRDLPTTLVSDSALLATLTVALWAAWAVFAGCVLIEAAAEIRGQVARRVTPAWPLQGLARALVASVAMAIGSQPGASCRRGRRPSARARTGQGGRRAGVATRCRDGPTTPAALGGPRDDRGRARRRSLDPGGDPPR
jgi:hypothetical protein